jgi:hypothetical protein
MNTFNYLWSCHLEPARKPIETDIFVFFIGIDKKKPENSGLIFTLGTFFLCSAGTPGTESYLRQDNEYENDENDVVISLRRIKYRFLLYVLQNKFITPDEKSEFLDVFQKVQNRYFAFGRLAYLWKWRRAHVTIKTDLFLNTIEEDKRNTYVLYQGGRTKFQFIVSDLIRLMEMAIWQNWEGCFRVNSRPPSNPYTNKELRVVDLYNIYYHMKWKMDVIIPQFFHLWFLDGFCLYTFKRNHDRYIRKMCIRQFAMTTSHQNQMLYKNVREMLNEYYYTCKWRIHDDFPKDILVDAMRPYLYLHYLVTFDIVSLRLTSYYEILLDRALIRFFNFNKLFGQKNMDVPIHQFSKSYFNPPFCETLPDKKQVVTFHTESLEFATWHL